MVCSNCGYENPSEHRYCGMCGTPFPHRALTVPGAQSTLNFISSPLEVPTAAVSEPVRPALVEPEPVVEEPIADPPRGTEPDRVSPTEAAGDPQEDLAILAQAATSSELTPAAEQDSAVIEEPAPRETASIPVTEATVPQEETASAMPAEPVVKEVLATLEREIPAEPSQPVQEPEQPSEPPAREPEGGEPEVREPEPETPEVIREPPPEPEQTPATRQHPIAAVGPPMDGPTPPAPEPIAPRVIVMPPPRATEPAPREVSAQDLARVHPPPDSLPLTSPPASSGMPTFKEISEASGPPAISPFEPPKQSHAAEDRELEDFVANFRWSPPAETADELTMRSEVPVIDKEAPAEFHHPSFDGDVAPPPEVGPHPTGQEYYAADGTAPRARFLDVSESSSSGRGRQVGIGSSILGADATPAIIPPDVSAEGSRRRLWLVGSILALVAIFGGLGYLEGRAQSTHEFRGPVEIAREEYGKARQWLRAKIELATASQSSAPEMAETAKPGNQTDTTAPPVTSQPESAKQNPVEEMSSQPTEGVATGETQRDNAGASSEPMDTGPPKPIEAPLPQQASKPQPGQQELVKALNASDAAAAAAWLWKSTSRGNPDAPVRLADMYIRGNGVPKSCEQALVLLRSAAMKENAPARNRLAALYANGSCVSRDPVKAYQLMTSALAADPNSDWARENRQLLWNQMTREQRAEAGKAQ